MKKILDVTKPVFAVDVDDANLLAVLGKYQNSTNFKKWFIRNFIDLWCYDRDGVKTMGFDKPFSKNLDCFREERTKHDYFDKPFPDSSIHDCELLTTIQMERDSTEKKYDTIVDFVKEYIDKEYYLFFEIDSFYIPVAVFHHHSHYNSRTLIYGYDDEKQTINTADFYGPFDRNVSYKFREIHYKDFVNAYSSYECSKNLEYERLLAFKYKDKEISVNKGELKYALKRYLLDFDDTYNNIYYGIKCYDAIQEELEKKYIDFKLFNFMAAHAEAMKLRVEYMKELGIIAPEIETNEFERFRRNANTCKNVLFKYVVSQDRNVKEKVSDSYKLLREQDILCTKMIVDAIKGEENVYRWEAGLKKPKKRM